MNHSIGVTLKFADFAAGGSDHPRTPPGDLVGRDHRLALRSAAAAARAAWASADMARPCQEWNRDDISNLSSAFDGAISSSALADIEMLAHEWLAADKPQLIELKAGRRIGDSLVATAEHRVIQLRRADDFVSGRTSHTLVQQELKATTKLIDEASLTENQSRRLLTAAGELAQLAAWVAADAGLYKQAPAPRRSGPSWRQFLHA